MFNTNWTHDYYILQIFRYKLHARLVYRYKLHTGGSWHRVPSTSNSRRWSSERRRCSIYGISGRTNVSSIVKCILRTLLVFVTQCFCALPASDSSIPFQIRRVWRRHLPFLLAGSVINILSSLSWMKGPTIPIPYTSCPQVDTTPSLLK